MEHRTPIRIILTITLTLWAVASQAYADVWNYSCEGWIPSSLQHGGQVAVELSDDLLTWSNGRKIYTAKFVDGSQSRKTYIDDASVYIVYGLWLGVSSVKAPLKIVRIFYTSASVRFSELTCQEN